MSTDKDITEKINTGDQPSTLQRIELLLQIRYSSENEPGNHEERLLQVFNRLSEYMSTTKSMLHECMLSLAESVVELLDDENELENEDSDEYSYHSQSDSDSEYGSDNEDYASVESDEDGDRVKSCSR